MIPGFPGIKFFLKNCNLFYPHQKPVGKSVASAAHFARDEIVKGTVIELAWRHARKLCCVHLTHLDS